MNHWGVAYPDFTLDVKANKLFEPRRGRVERGLKDGRLPSPFTFQNGRERRLSGYCARLPTACRWGNFCELLDPWDLL